MNNDKEYVGNGKWVVHYKPSGMEAIKNFFISILFFVIMMTMTTYWYLKDKWRE